MSEIKVNKISPRTACGTTTLGDSGDTFTIPAGVSITNNGTASGFGATGSASWNTTVKTGDFTAVAGEGYFVNTTSGEIDVALPAGTAGAVVAIKDYANTWQTSNCILVPNGSDKIGGINASATFTTEGQAATLIFVDSTRGWLVTDDGLQSVADNNPYLEATGGAISESGNCRIHTFTGPGTFTVSKTANAAADNLVSYVVVAGGGSGGNAKCGTNGNSGGAGAGGYREVVSPSSPYTGSPLDGYGTIGNRITVTATAYPIDVGGGGTARTTCSAGNPGSNSTFSTITSAGGGGGGGGPGTGLNGGSGGGGSNAGSPGNGNTPPTTPPQGNNGGAQYSPGTPCTTSGGGGGAGAVGANGNPGGPAGNGGAGVTSEITASPVARAGGGGGGGNSGQTGGGTGGTGGGGAGGTYGGPACGVDATDNTGGGGGATASNCTSPVTSGKGGSGVIVIRYRYQ